MCRIRQTQFDSLFFKGYLLWRGSSPRAWERSQKTVDSGRGGNLHVRGWGPGQWPAWKRWGVKSFFLKSENTLTALRTKLGALLVWVIKWRSVQECGLLEPHSCRRLWEERLLTSCDCGLSPWDFLSWAVLRAPAIPQPLAFPPTSSHHL